MRLVFFWFSIRWTGYRLLELLLSASLRVLQVHLRAARTPASVDYFMPRGVHLTIPSGLLNPSVWLLQWLRCHLHSCLVLQLPPVLLQYFAKATSMKILQTSVPTPVYACLWVLLWPDISGQVVHGRGILRQGVQVLTVLLPDFLIVASSCIMMIHTLTWV